MAFLVKYSIPLNVVFFLFLWVGMMKLISAMSGWSRLAGKFHFVERFEGQLLRFQTARLKKVRFNACLNLGLAQWGLYLLPVLPFRLFHSPLLIPWEEIRAEPVKEFLFKGHRLGFQSFPEIPLDIRESTYRKILDYLIQHRGFDPSQPPGPVMLGH